MGEGGVAREVTGVPDKSIQLTPPLCLGDFEEEPPELTCLALVWKIEFWGARFEIKGPVRRS